MDLSDFLLARIAEDESTARAASGSTVEGEPYNWTPVADGDEWEPAFNPRTLDAEVLVALRQGLTRPPAVMDGYWGQVLNWDVYEARDFDGYHRIAQHIARHDPARVLAECEAKRRIVAGEGADLFRAFQSDDHVAGWAMDGVLKWLALPYADHPDFRPEWSPVMAG